MALMQSGLHCGVGGSLRRNPQYQGVRSSLTIWLRRALWLEWCPCRQGLCYSWRWGGLHARLLW